MKSILMKKLNILIIIFVVIINLPGQCQQFIQQKTSENHQRFLPIEDLRPNVIANFSQSHRKTSLSFSKSLQWNWDTIIIHDTLNYLCRETRTFDNHGYVVTHCHDAWNGTNWSKYCRDSLSYDANGNLFSDFWQRWNGINNTWVNDIINTYSYNSSGQVLTNVFQEWHSNVQINLRISTYTYDANGNLLNYFYQEYHTSVLTNMLKETYTYDGNGNNLTYLTESWQNNIWTYDSRLTNTYDSNNHLLTKLREGRQNNSWANEYLYTFTYDTNGNNLSELSEVWQNGAFINNRLWIHSYNVNGQLLSDTEKCWISNAWSIAATYTYTYDNYGNRLTYLNESTYINNQPQDKQLNTYTYDVNGNMLSDMFQYWDSITYVNVQLLTYTYDDNGNSISGKYQVWNSDHWAPWMDYDYLKVISNKENVFYISVGHKFEASFVSSPTGIEKSNNQHSNFSIFPNPFTTSTQITLDKTYHHISLAVYDMQGKLMLQKQYTDQTQIQLNREALNNGMYFLKLTLDERWVETGKVIISE
jgi:hypothetical protein